MRIFYSGCLLFVMAGCTGDLVDIGAGAKQDMAFSDVDMVQAGGGEMGPINTKFNPDIQTDLDKEGCTLGACHGTMGNGSVMYVKAMATVQADIDANYMNVLKEVNKTAPDQSPLLRNPLAGSGSGHAGTTPFASTNDATYQKWLAWISAGASP
jgi:hypothetical protein